MFILWNWTPFSDELEDITLDRGRRQGWPNCSWPWLRGHAHREHNRQLVIGRRIKEEKLSHEDGRLEKASARNVTAHYCCKNNVTLRFWFRTRGRVCSCLTQASEQISRWHEGQRALCDLSWFLSCGPCLSLCCWTGPSLVVASRGYYLWCVGFSGGGISSCRAQVLERVRFRSCGSWAHVPLGMWDLPGPGMGAHVPCTGMRILTHRTTREAQACTLDHPAWLASFLWTTSAWNISNQTYSKWALSFTFCSWTHSDFPLMTTMPSFFKDRELWGSSGC